MNELMARSNYSAGAIQTVEGDVQGVVANEVSEFLGIPYAAPPLGELRW
jgi:para-nitrobenzyl esterase